MDKVVRGELEDESTAAAASAKDAADKQREDEEAAAAAAAATPVDVGEEPPIPEFILNVPNITAIDLCVLPLFSLLPYAYTSPSHLKMASTHSFRLCTQGYHQAHRTLHRTARSAVPCGPFRTRGP